MVNRKAKSGFTLLELLIVVIIVSILAAVALPQFGRMTRRARGAEAAAAVGAFLTAEYLYYQENGRFTTVQGELLVDAPAGGNFTYAFVLTGTTQVRTTATGIAGTPVAGMTVTGTVSDLGAKTALITAG